MLFCTLEDRIFQLRTQACKTQGLTRPAPSADGSQPYREGPRKGQVNLSKDTATKRLLHPPSDVINGDVLNFMPVIHIVEHDSAAAWHRHCSACWPTFVCKQGASGIVSFLLKARGLLLVPVGLCCWMGITGSCMETTQ
ncbi:unnamed protein product [Symbiodinium necroappetens]|uniref:Uncharacterized protein n=1 Tax=Symbiodinium necroappetens TaxID=1628268 RepID=A0A812XME1_9DINO|nr:unnamed protein product [Symbiodinium necroappetens]